jgi:hypothetical protein
MDTVSAATTKRNRGGRPRGIVRRTHVSNGAYSENLDDVMSFWEKHNPGNAARVQELVSGHLRFLGWTREHERFLEVRDLSIRVVSCDLLLMKILDMDYTRLVKDPLSGGTIRERAADQFTRLYKLDDEIQGRMMKLGLYSKINKNKETKYEERAK